jgi:hypothetical protein
VLFALEIGFDLLEAEDFEDAGFARLLTGEDLD